MAKRKANDPSPSQHVRTKKLKHKSSIIPTEPIPLDQTSSADNSDGGVELQETGFKINEEFAKKFEHNKKREELQRLEEKYSQSNNTSKEKYGDKYDEDSESSNDEEEDDIGFLATEELDAQISATLQAIRSKDPVVYNEKFSFYTPIEENEDHEKSTDEAKTQKPMYLRDYHRENLLKGFTKDENEEDNVPITFAQEQEKLQKSLVQEMHDAADDKSEADEDGGFLVPKTITELSHGLHPLRRSKVQPEIDVSNADKDPETFLSNFMAARAWQPSDGVRFQPLQSDDESEDDRAERFEAAYNLRFENPEGSNEILKSYARDIVAAKSVRRDEPSGRKRQRDAQREKKEAEMQVKEEEKAQLRRLKVEEIEKRLKMIKKAAGFRGETFNHEKLMQLLDESWDDEKWMDGMKNYFGEDYYASQEVVSDNATDVEVKSGHKKKFKKPKWDDDIDIKDILPEFDGEVTKRLPFLLSDSDFDSEAKDNKSETKKNRRQDKQAQKKDARRERRCIEEFVDSHLELEIATGSKQQSQFRYRETSPFSFGLTARDILMASDTSLNQFAGLKKMATFRDPEKKRRDKKSLGKKARLRQWRKETFGNEDGPQIVLSAITPSDPVNKDIVDSGKKKKKRARKIKQQSENTE